MSTIDQVNQLIREKINGLVRELPIIIGNEAKLFAVENFQRQEWRGKTVEKWKPRKDENNQKALLVDNSHLFNSVENAVVTPTGKGRVTVTIGGTRYGRVHNYGFKGKVTQNVKPFTRRAKNGKPIKVKGFTRTVNMNIPKRQFIGNFKESPMMKRRILSVIKKDLEQRFNS